MIVGHNDAARIDDEAGAQRIDLMLALVATAVLEEIVEEFIEGRIRRQARIALVAVVLLRRRLLALLVPAVDGLGRGDVDHRVDHLLRDIGDAVRPARESRLRGTRRHHQKTTRNGKRKQAAQSHKRVEHRTMSPGRECHSGPRLRPAFLVRKRINAGN